MWRIARTTRARQGTIARVAFACEARARGDARTRRRVRLIRAVGAVAIIVVHERGWQHHRGPAVNGQTAVRPSQSCGRGGGSGSSGSGDLALPAAWFWARRLLLSLGTMSLQALAHGANHRCCRTCSKVLVAAWRRCSLCCGGAGGEQGVVCQHEAAGKDGDHSDEHQEDALIQRRRAADL